MQVFLQIRTTNEESSLSWLLIRFSRKDVAYDVRQINTTFTVLVQVFVVAYRTIKWAEIEMECKK